MTNWDIKPELVQLLSDITEQPLRSSDIQPLFVFVTALAIVLRGTIVMDKVVAAEEEQRQREMLALFLTPETGIAPMVRRAISGVEQQQSYLNPNALPILLEPFSEAAKLLLLGLGCEISAADGSIDFREKIYLQSIALRLHVDLEHLEVLEAGFSPESTVDPEAVREVRTLLDPQNFSGWDAVLATAADRLRSHL